VIAVGNAYLSDDGVGGRVLDALSGMVSGSVELIDAGISGPDLVTLVAGKDKVVVVDAVDAGGPPGTIHRFGPGQLESPEEMSWNSLHHGNVVLYVKVAQALGNGPREVVVIGVQPQSLSPGTGLSAAVEAAVPGAAREVLREIRSSAGASRCAR
jgi:hydrogenase maturation protease